jgi:hypothetical protein
MTSPEPSDTRPAADVAPPADVAAADVAPPADTAPDAAASRDTAKPADSARPEDTAAPVMGPAPIQMGPEIAVMSADIRWVGNEAGIAPPGTASVQVRNNTPVWYPAECDVSIRPGWFHHDDQDSQVKSLDQLLDIYFKSVGRNCPLLLNIPPDKRA